MKKTVGALAVISLVAAFAAAAVGAARAAAPTRSDMGSMNIVQVAAASPQIRTLVALVKKAGLAGALSKGSLTVFAPTNAAFAYLKAHQPASTRPPRRTRRS